MAEQSEQTITVEYVPGSSPVQMLVVPEDEMEGAKEAIKKLVSNEAFDEENGNGNGNEQTLGLSGSNCRRTRRRDILCADED